MLRCSTEHQVSFPEVIATILKASPDALVHTLPKGSPLFPQLPAHFLSNFSTPITDQYLLPALQRVRPIKDADEIALIRKANAISSRAHEMVMRVLGLAVKNKIAREEGAGIKRPLLPGKWSIEQETEIETIFMASSIHQAYLPTVAASTRAATLHYCCNDKEFAWGPDGPTDHLNNQSLTVPSSHPHPHVSTPHTMKIQPPKSSSSMPGAAAFGLIKPGVHWDRVHLECHKVLIGGFLALGLSNGGSEEEILKSGVSGVFFPHGLGHSLGMDVHDVPEASEPAKNLTVPTEDVGNESFYAYLRLRLLLEVGMVVTVEPGVYFHPHLIAPVLGSKYIDREVLEKYESVGGVRIEDVIVITQSGYDNLTTVRSERSWVEGVCSGEL
ncbi:hypothetical protein P691DRAFT_809068 [Macrolepiota fuliginosa MF-IS2]|uniref:Peptidase M24 domain-containing protein n=1 Tax=Macrolepiota fuliginosa MF-IS2 TaxID=1400762 RepID=A0A9P6BZ82_9AGAR|nr:hypothetical protein P691DRAFT_809068 [Macrolepiota fuliginosa MF-IS2]